MILDKINVNDALELLKNKIVLIDKYNRFYFYLNSNIVCKFDSNCFKINESDFVYLYKDELFFEYNIDDISIDDLKDIEYYRNYRK